MQGDSRASAFIDEAASKGEHVGVSAITIVEIVYLMEKGRIPSSALADLRGAILDEAAVLLVRRARRKDCDENAGSAA